jgi:hypothetical protein
VKTRPKLRCGDSQWPERDERGDERGVFPVRRRSKKVTLQENALRYRLDALWRLIAILTYKLPISDDFWRVDVGAILRKATPEEKPS